MHLSTLVHIASAPLLRILTSTSSCLSSADIGLAVVWTADQISPLIPPSLTLLPCTPGVKGCREANGVEGQANKLQSPLECIQLSLSGTEQLSSGVLGSSVSVVQDSRTSRELQSFLNFKDFKKSMCAN